MQERGRYTLGLAIYGNGNAVLSVTHRHYLHAIQLLCRDVEPYTRRGALSAHYHYTVVLHDGTVKPRESNRPALNYVEHSHIVAADNHCYAALASDSAVIRRDGYHSVAYRNPIRRTIR